MKRSELDRIILEQYAFLENAKKIKDLPVSFKTAIEKRYGKIHPKDFFTKSLSQLPKAKIFRCYSIGRIKHSELNEQSCKWNDSTTRIGFANAAEWNFGFLWWKLILILES